MNGPALAPLRDRRFRWYFASRAVDLLGDIMGGVALAFAVLEVSDSPSALGIVLAAHSIPMVAFLLIGGVLADRFGRTLIIQLSNVTAGVDRAGDRRARAERRRPRSGSSPPSPPSTASPQPPTSPPSPGCSPSSPRRAHSSRPTPSTGCSATSRSCVAPAVAGALVVGVGAGLGDRDQRRDLPALRRAPAPDQAARRRLPATTATASSRTCAPGGRSSAVRRGSG